MQKNRKAVAVLELELANRILHHPGFQQEMALLQELEKERIFCRHDIEHCLSVARLTMLLCAEKGLDADADRIYAAALLHDIGRAAEYRDGTPHQQAGMILAGEILDECGCPEWQKEQILRLIASHRKAATDETLEQIFYLADKRSRNCFACAARKECCWPPEKRTMEIKG